MTVVVLSDCEEDRGGARGEEGSSDNSNSDSAAAGVMTVVVMLRSDGGHDNHSDCDEDHYGRDLHLLSPCYVPSSMLNTEHSLSHLTSCNM